MSDPQAPRSVTSFCAVVVWQAPRRVYGVITGYDVRFVKFGSDGVTGEASVVITKNRDELFHRVQKADLPRGEGEVLVQVHTYIYMYSYNTQLMCNHEIGHLGDHSYMYIIPSEARFRNVS